MGRRRAGRYWDKREAGRPGPGRRRGPAALLPRPGSRRRCRHRPRGGPGPRRAHTRARGPGGPAAAPPRAPPGGVVPAGAVATDREAGRVCADLIRVLGDPAHRRVAVVDRRREPVLGGQPVTSHDDQRAGGVGQAAADAVGRVDGAEDPAAAEEIEQRGQRPLAGGPVQPQRQLAAGPGDLQIGDLVDGLRLAPPGPGRGKVGGPGVGERHGVERRNVVTLALVAYRLQLRVEGHSSQDKLPFTGNAVLNRDRVPAPMVELVRESLHTSVPDPVSASMNFLNEVASRFPAAISLAAGRPFDEFYAVTDVERYLAAYVGYLRAQGTGEARVRQAILQYGRTNGQLGAMIARMLEIDEGIRVPAESVMVTSGCQEAMIIALRGLCAGPEDVVLAAEPCYVGFTGAARVLGVTVVPGPETAQGLRPETVARVAREVRASGHRPRALYVVSNFANPSGVSLSADVRRGLIEVAADQDLLILEDDPYGLFGLDDRRTPALKSLDTGQRVIYLGSFAKSVFPGARVGFLVAGEYRPEEHTSELQSPCNLVCRLLLEKKN